MSARDARRATLRALLAACAAALLAALFVPLSPVLLSTCVWIGLVVFVLAWLELRAWRVERSFAVTAVAAVGVLLLPLQVAYVSAVLETGSFEQAVQLALARTGDVRAPLLVLAVAAIAPFPVVADLRRHGGREETTLLATAAVAPAGCLSFGLLLIPPVVILGALLAVYGLADRVEGLLWPEATRQERSTYRTRSSAWPYSRRWLLAYAGYPLARELEGARGPPTPRDLGSFLAGLLPAGREAYDQAGRLVARLLLPLVDDPSSAARGALAALERADRAPGEAARALAAWRPDAEPARMFKGLVEALDGEPVPTITTLACFVSDAAQLTAARMADPTAVHEAIRGALIAWALRDG